MIDFQKIDAGIKPKVKVFVAQNWGAELMVSRGRVHMVADLEGFVITEAENIIGLVTYCISNLECEVISLDSIQEKKGIGTMLMNLVIEEAQRSGCNRIWLITTNDNVKALRFYQKRGFDICAFYKNAVDVSRAIKPEIPRLGLDGIEIKHEFELERRL